MAFEIWRRDKDTARFEAPFFYGQLNMGVELASTSAACSVRIEESNYAGFTFYIVVMDAASCLVAWTFVDLPEDELEAFIPTLIDLAELRRVQELEKRRQTMKIGKPELCDDIYTRKNWDQPLYVYELEVMDAPNIVCTTTQQIAGKTNFNTVMHAVLFTVIEERGTDEEMEALKELLLLRAEQFRATLKPEKEKT